MLLLTNEKQKLKTLVLKFKHGKDLIAEAIDSKNATVKVD